MGDSLLSTNSLGRQSVPDNVDRILRKPVIDRSVPGVRISYILPITGSMGLNIGKQYAAGNWEWIILNGGGNDLVFGCGCNNCDRKMNQLITEDGSSGKITTLVRKLRATGAQVVYVGYLRSPGLGSPIERCKNEGDELERRIALLSETDDGIHFLSIADMVPYGDRSYHGLDMVHPSAKASKAIAHRIATLISNQ
ncbi:SGNH/GDSL hydrolase family protein [Roseovarius albus]|nr:SGNH/GDSL hydrolase family protein [Roseovarius albus]